LSVITAALLRLPPKKGLYGFYTIHGGLILIGVGSFVTFYAGIDGTISLYPNESIRKIVLDSDIFTIAYPDKGEQVIYDLPYVALEKKINDRYGPVKLLRYLPFSEKKTRWLRQKHAHHDNEDLSSAQYLISNDNIAQDFILSLHPEALDFKADLTMGPLNIYYLPNMGHCFAKNSPSGLFFWNKKKKSCFSPEERGITVSHTSSKKKFLVIKKLDKAGYYSFFPEISPWPLDENKRPLTDSPLRVFYTRFFEKKPHLFLFGKEAAFFNQKKWEHHQLPENGSLPLPWMGFSLELLRHETEIVPKMIPEYSFPKQIDGKLVQADEKALEVQVGEENWWVTDKTPLSLLVEGEKIYLYINKRELQLPFEFSLTNFKMKKNPGTEDPASYESFVKMFTKNGYQNHHIYMNNPLKYAGFTFYQSSYFQTEKGEYGSVLSANMDPGRFIKYLGSFLLIAGAIWHYRIRRRQLLK
ncbi:MAG: cytochrome c biogenesis protein ResB, partial [Halobacteriovoraceae bacterium]|nr:cytochrome c biogenesis protein ResB [Halobacteriovoraceae bacterium]